MANYKSGLELGLSNGSDSLLLAIIKALIISVVLNSLTNSTYLGLYL
jgi:hypothetical protein